MTDHTRIIPGPGQESVWDYPRPPIVVPVARRIRVMLGGIWLVDTTSALRVLETSHPPVYYVPRDAVLVGALTPNPRRSWCEFKGEASYWDVAAGESQALAAAWSYESPTPEFAVLAGYVAFYPGRMEACFVDDERIQAQSGDFYGGWVTADVTGPFKGGPGTLGW
jgi:uncharacterized protein (DUF427 family)